MWGGLIGYQGNQHRGTAPHLPFDKLSLARAQSEYVGRSMM